jgi:hypothetical protein
MYAGVSELDPNWAEAHTIKDTNHLTAFSKMSKHMLPKTDSMQALAEFWQTHDLTDFEDQLEEVVDPVFVRPSEIENPTTPNTTPDSSS